MHSKTKKLRHGRLVGAICVVGLATGCEGYKAPCDAASEEVLIDTGLGAGLCLVEAADGSAMATWFRFQAGASPSQVLIPSGAELVVFHDDGAILRRASFPVPQALAQRKGNTSNIGVVAAGSGLVFHWTEESESTLDDGTWQSTTALRLQWMAEDGHEGPLLAPVPAACSGCELHLSSVPFGDSAVILYQPIPLTPVLGAGPEATPLGLAAVSADGALAGAGAISWVKSAAPAGSRPSACSNSLVVPRLEVQKGTLLLFSTGGTFRMDTALQPSAGPIPLPAPTMSKVRWLAGSDHVLAAWTGTAPGVGELPDLLVRRFRDTGAAEAAVQRVSTANDVLGVAEGGGVMGVIFSAEEGEYFALADSQGAKIGGDVALGGGQAPSDGASSLQSHVLLAAAARRFTSIHVRGAAIIRQEIVCE